ncbi:MAG: hypothetical protein ACYC6L_16750 [Anaerolineae bacterium]
MYPRSPLTTALIGLISHEQLGSINFVYTSHSNHDIKGGFASVSPRRSVPYWDLEYMAPALDTSASASNIWDKLLTHLGIYGASCGVSRIYARTAEDPEVEDILHQVGYTIVSRSEVFVLVNRPSPVMAPRGLHRLEPQDAASLYRLFHEVVPPLAQQAEGLPSHWSSIKTRRLGMFSKFGEYIWVEKNRANAYFCLCETGRANWLHVVVRPEYRAEILPLIKHVLASSENPIVPTYCEVPDYSVGTGWLLRALGFESYAKQVTMVEHTLVRVPVFQRVLVPGLEASPEVGSPARPVFRCESELCESTVNAIKNVN